MSDTDNDKPKLGMRAPLGLKRTVETGKVKQSFSHGRSNTVVVEVKRRRILGRPGEAEPHVEATPEPEVAQAAVAEAPRPAPAPAPRPAPAPVTHRPLSPLERREQQERLLREADESRMNALEESRRREERSRVESIEDERRRVEEKARTEEEAREGRPSSGDEVSGCLIFGLFRTSIGISSRGPDMKIPRELLEETGDVERGVILG